MITTRRRNDERTTCMAVWTWLCLGVFCKQLLPESVRLDQNTNFAYPPYWLCAVAYTWCRRQASQAGVLKEGRRAQIMTL